MENAGGACTPRAGLDSREVEDRLGLGARLQGTRAAVPSRHISSCLTRRLSVQGSLAGHPRGWPREMPPALACLIRGTAIGAENERVEF